MASLLPMEWRLGFLIEVDFRTTIFLLRLWLKARGGRLGFLIEVDFLTSIETGIGLLN